MTQPEVKAVRPGERVLVHGTVEAIFDGQALVKIERPNSDGSMGHVLVPIHLHRVVKP